jgi:hypothetical protein
MTSHCGVCFTVLKVVTSRYKSVTPAENTKN